VITWLLAGCGEPADPPAEAFALSPAEQLVRLSVDLRGVRPTREELDRVERNPEAIDALVDEFLADPRFGDRAVALYREVLLTKLEDVQLLDDAAGEVLVPDPRALATSAGDEPARLLAHLAVNDLPYDLAVTADFTVVDDVLAPYWPTDRAADASGWTVARYTDGRPPAGVLATNGLWWRYPSTASNLQRKRGNVASRLFTCRDFLKTVVPFDNTVDLLDEEALADAIRTQDSCRACHDELEPLSAYFWGFDFEWADGFYLSEAVRYHPERERSWVDEAGVAPGFGGRRGDTLPDLGRQLLADDRFETCAVSHVWTHLLRREPGDVPLDRHVQAFEDGGRTVKAIVRSVVRDPRYRGAGPDGVARKVLTPDTLRSVVLDLTGFDWTIDGLVLLDSEEDGGLATLAGGIDGRTVTAPATEPNTTTSLVQDHLATGAAAFAVRRESKLPRDERRLFRVISDLGDAVNDEAVREQLVGLSTDVLSRRPATDDPEVESLLGLYRELEALSDPQTAWVGVLSALLRDVALVTY
jgi:hypothetical protein